MLSNISQKKTYLVYQVGTCEMGTEGCSSIHFPCIAQGDTKEEVVENYIDNVEALYRYRLEPKYIEKSDSYIDYYPIEMKELTLSVYGHIRELNVETVYEKHTR